MMGVTIRRSKAQRKMLLLLFAVLISVPAHSQDSVDLVWKFRSLQNNWTSNSALPWFLAHKDDPEVRKYLAIHLSAALIGEALASHKNSPRFP